jgi:hypothetical protein
MGHVWSWGPFVQTESDASAVFDAVLESKASATVTWGDVCSYLYDSTPQTTLQNMLEMPDCFSPT